MKTPLVIAILLILGVSSQAQNNTVLYSFFVAGHTYGEPGVNNEGFHPPFKQKFGYIQGRPEIEFGVLTGDIVSSNPVAQDWDEIDSDIGLLGIPAYFAVGNHDMENRPLFENRYGSTYYDFIHENDLFIVLDPNIDEWNISGTQMQFLQDVLIENASITDNIYVFFHQILWKENGNQFDYIHWNSSAGRGSTVNFWTEVEPLFRALPNEVVMFAGDLGASWTTDMSYDHYDNITLISSGMGDADGENFIVVNVHSNKSVSYDLICLSDPNINCLGALTDYLVVDEILLVNDSYVEESNNIRFYPNPTIDYITVTDITKSKVTIQLFNIHGELVLEEICHDKKKYTIDVRHIPKGIYLVRIITDFNRSTVRLVIE